MWDHVQRFFYCGDTVYNFPAWADETVDCAVRWNRVNWHFNIIDLAGGNLWNRHWLEWGFNQSAFRIRPTSCMKYFILDNLIWQVLFVSVIVRTSLLEYDTA